MLGIALVAVAAFFVLLTVGRVGGARRKAVAAHWPSIAFALAATFALYKGAIGPALGLAALACLAWLLAPMFREKPASPQPRSNAGDAEAFALLGLGPAATESEIRGAYRAKMRSAHPDKGGTQNEAARLTAARDRLLKRGKPKPAR